MKIQSKVVKKEAAQNNSGRAPQFLAFFASANFLRVQ
jgi:hypothetical protein